ncbi:hypothetical protein I6A60_40305 [Frankia sp. AgB1.9]|uniref:hypothetical protein n=1 Tax=unclassified Frankia TaxID=2632575 RepID=UPI001933F763|nr:MULTISPECIES: hypothetical protein [unclassified Frankia]MBL7486517.1 hypothetical protein [Frankia sp. AgW1.1]MBL7554026.1 hypothetical protein [Frankia sp. AgB1.9]MBL7618208.1 hypothetical protein [Frankia sp. AgB1.8]
MPTDTNPSALDTAEETFLSLTGTPPGLCLDGRTVHGELPARRVGLRELRVALGQPRWSAGARDALWTAVLAHRDDPAWLIGATGLAMAPLRHIAAALTTVRVEKADLEGEVLTGFVAQIRAATGPAREAVLLWGALRAGLAAAHHDALVRLTYGACLPLLAAIPTAPWLPGPQAILQQAVRLGLISALEYQLIHETRVQDRRLLDFDPDAGEELAVIRAKAEGRLVTAILDGRLAPTGGPR